MHRTDARLLGSGALGRLRHRAVQLVLSGMRQRAVARRLRLRPATLSAWVGLFRQRGREALLAARTGRPPQHGLHGQRETLLRMLGAPPPGPPSLWTLPAIAREAAARWRVHLSMRSWRRLLADLGVLPLPADYALRRWSDWIRLPDVRGLIPPGAAPYLVTHHILPEPPRWRALLAIDARGRIHLRLVHDPLRARCLLAFLDRLAQGIAERPAVVALDAHPLHRAPSACRWFAQRAPRLRACHVGPLRAGAG